MIHFDCEYDECPGHDYPDDWRFGGPNETHPGADPRWEPTTYQYYDEQLHEVFMSQGPLCDEEAFDIFTWINSFKGFNPVYVAAKRPGTEKYEMLPVKYNPETDTVSDLQKV